MALFYGNEIKPYVNEWGVELIAYVVKPCEEKMRKWLIRYFQELHHENETYTLKFLHCYVNPGNECVFCFDKPHAPSLRSFMESRGPMPLEEAEVIIAALIKALTNGQEKSYQCLTPDTVFYDATEHRIQILPICPAGTYEHDSAPMEIAPEAWKPEVWFADYSEIPANWTPDVAAADVFSIGVLYMELVAGSTDWPHLNKMLSTQQDFPEKIIRCCCHLPALRPYLTELLTQTPVSKSLQKRFVSTEQAHTKTSGFFGSLKQKFSGFQDMFGDDDDDFDTHPRNGGDNETR